MSDYGSPHVTITMKKVYLLVGKTYEIEVQHCPDLIFTPVVESNIQGLNRLRYVTKDGVGELPYSVITEVVDADGRQIEYTRIGSNTYASALTLMQGDRREEDT